MQFTNKHKKYLRWWLLFIVLDFLAILVVGLNLGRSAALAFAAIGIFQCAVIILFFMRITPEERIFKYILDVSVLILMIIMVIISFS